jgi:uncharacterized protein YecT (DUF1311 family)
MPTHRTLLHSARATTAILFSALTILGATSQRCSASDHGSRVSSPAPHPQDDAASPHAAEGTYDKAIFQKPIPADQMAFLSHFSGARSSDLAQDKQFRKLMHHVIPDCTFHYGSDMPMTDALDMVFRASRYPVQVRDERYLLLAGDSGPYLAGRGFLWIDMVDGIGLGGFYFRPTNGEPTPTVTVFSRQVKEKTLRLSQLPPAFVDQLRSWSSDFRIPVITTRYFITGGNEKILLEHDEDFCTPADPTFTAPTDCEQMNADAADIDMNAAYYLDQTHHATNATAWMIVSNDQVAWVRVRDDTCRSGPDPLKCRVRMTHDHIHTLTGAPSTPHTPHAQLKFVPTGVPADA